MERNRMKKIGIGYENYKEFIDQKMTVKTQSGRSAQNMGLL